MAAKKKPLVVAYVEVYKDAKAEFRWRAKAANNKIIAESGEGYRNRSYALKVARELHPGIPVIRL